jgi:hypothetical protein
MPYIKSDAASRAAAVEKFRRSQEMKDRMQRKPANPGGNWAGATRTLRSGTAAERRKLIGDPFADR